MNIFKRIAIKVYNIISFIFLSGIWLIGAIIVTGIYFAIFGGLYEVFGGIFEFASPF